MVVPYHWIDKTILKSKKWNVWCHRNKTWTSDYLLLTNLMRQTSLENKFLYILFFIDWSKNITLWSTLLFNLAKYNHLHKRIQHWTYWKDLYLSKKSYFIVHERHMYFTLYDYCNIPISVCRLANWNFNTKMIGKRYSLVLYSFD